MAAAIYYNVSLSEDDPFEEDGLYFGGTSAVYFTVVAIIRFVLILVVIAADIFIMIIICRFKKLKTRLNVLIFNCFLLHAFLYIKDPLIFIIIYPFIQVGMSFYRLECHTHTMILSLYFIFALILAIDWLSSSHKPHLLNAYKKHYKYLIFGLYFLFGMEWCLRCIFFLNYGSNIYFYKTEITVRLVMYIIALIGITIINILAKKLSLHRESSKTAYALTVSNVIVYSYLPMLIFTMVESFVNLHKVLMYFLMYTESIPELLATANNIYAIYMLGRQNKYFKMAYDRCFNRSRRGYESENFSESEEENDVDSNTINSQNAVNDNSNQAAEAILVL